MKKWCQKKKKNIANVHMGNLVQNFAPYFYSYFLSILRRLSFDGPRKKKVRPHHFSLFSQLNTFSIHLLFYFLSTLKHPIQTNSYGLGFIWFGRKERVCAIMDRFTGVEHPFVVHGSTLLKGELVSMLGLHLLCPSLNAIHFHAKFSCNFIFNF